jgi:hypothetical protein
MKNDNLDHENRPIKYGITPDDLKLLHQRRIEEAALRQAASDQNLLRAVQLGKKLRG